MVTELTAASASTLIWVLQPTRSMTWIQARRFIAVVTLVSLAIGGFFMTLGLPLVLPFSGVEALAVGIAFYLVVREGERREVIRLESDSLIIERGLRRIDDRLEFNRLWVRVELLTGVHKFAPHRLCITAEGRLIELGRFLTEDERETFAHMLINALKKNR